MEDEKWQSLSAMDTDVRNHIAHHEHRHRGPPNLFTGCGIFDVLLPLMCILGQIIDLHHLSHHPRVERESSSAVTQAFVYTIIQQLRDLEPSIAAIEKTDLSAAAGEDGRLFVLRHRRILSRYARFLYHLFHALAGTEWDKPNLIENDVYMHSSHFNVALEHTIASANILEEVMTLDPDLAFKPVFFGIFTFHAAAFPFASAARYKQATTPQVLAACETYVRVYEKSNCTHYAEYLVSQCRSTARCQAACPSRT